MKKIAIFASGSGSNAENIARFFNEKGGAKVACILSNKEDAFVHERAKKLDIPSYSFKKADTLEGGKVDDILNQHNVDFIVLAGYLLLFPAHLIAQYNNRIVNVHPALLPKFGGKGMYGDRVHTAVKEAEEKETGITIHYVNEHYDDGNIIFQAKTALDGSESVDDIAKKVHALEYEHFPKVIDSLLNELV